LICTLQQSYELMRHAKRRKLTTVDFNNALENADVQVIVNFFLFCFFIAGVKRFSTDFCRSSYDYFVFVLLHIVRVVYKIQVSDSHYSILINSYGLTSAVCGCRWTLSDVFVLMKKWPKCKANTTTKLHLACIGVGLRLCR